MKYLVLLLIFVYMIFPFGLKVFPKMPWLVHGIAILYLLVRINLVRNLLTKCAHYKTYLALFGVSYFGVLLWAVINIVLVNDTDDFAYVLYLLHVLDNILVYITLVILVHDLLTPQQLLKKFLLFYVLAVCFYVMVSFVMLLFPEVKEGWVNIIYMNPLHEELSSVFTYISRFGLCGFSGFKYTYICSSAMVIYLYYFNKWCTHSSGIFIFFVLLLGNFFYGRSGALFSLGCIFFSCIASSQANKIFTLLKLLFGISFLVAFAYCLIDFNPVLEIWFNWLIDPVQSFAEGIQYGRFSVGSSGDHMFEDMYFIPDHDGTILFGDGKYGTQNSYYMNTDVGIMRAMLFYGLVGEFLGYFSLLLLLKWLNGTFKLGKDAMGKLMSYMFAFQFVFFEFKGDLFVQLYGIVIAIVLAASYDFSNGLLIKNNRMGLESNGENDLEFKVYLDKNSSA